MSLGIDYSSLIEFPQFGDLRGKFGQNFVLMLPFCIKFRRLVKVSRLNLKLLEVRGTFSHLIEGKRVKRQQSFCISCISSR